MRQALFLPAALLLLGCQRQPAPQLARLQTQLTTQQDTLRQLRQELSRQQDSVRQARMRLAATQERLEETALAANALAAPSAVSVAPKQLAKPAPVGRLYGKAAVVTLPDTEMAEVLTLADSTSSASGGEFSVKAYRVCNGPADLTLDFCNCSHYVYLALDSGEMPYEYKLYRLGPFYEARLAGWAEGTGDYRGQPVLRIRHDMKGRQQTDTFRVSWRGVQRL